MPVAAGGRDGNGCDDQPRVTTEVDDAVYPFDAVEPLDGSFDRHAGVLSAVDVERAG